jgi:hypothetical protein
VVVPFSSSDLAVARHLPAGRHRAGDRHLKFHDYRDNLFRGETGIKGPDGKGHDSFVAPNFVVKSGAPVTVTVVNYDEGSHSMTAPGVGLDASITGGKALSNGKIGPVTTHFTFTPTTKGTFRWYCKIPCDKGANYWAMGPGYDGPSENGFMAGYIVVI